MRCRQPKSPLNLAGASLSSMIDIVFLLIIFFVVTANFDDAQIDSSVMLPSVSAGVAANSMPPERLVLNIHADGAVVMGYRELAAPEVGSALPSLLEQEFAAGVRILVLNGDGEARHRVIAPVLEAAAAAGFRDVRISALIGEER